MNERRGKITMKLINTVTIGIAGLAMILGTPVFAASQTLEEVNPIVA